MLHRFRLIPSLLLLVMASLAPGANAPPAPPPATPARPAQTFALLVGGLPGSPIYARHYRDWLTRFHKLLSASAVPPANIVVLSADKEFKSPILTGPATTDSILTAISTFSKSIRPDDQFILIILGHGSLSDSKPELVLPGPDLDPDALAKALTAVSADNQIILNFSGTSGDFLKSLGKKNRVNIAATSGQENAEPVFAEFFLRALESSRADGEGAPAAGAKDGVTSLLEAYNWATHQVALWIMRQAGNKDGTWTINGKESVEIFKKLYDGPEAPITPGGMRADGSRKLSDASDASRPDEPVSLVVPSDLKPKESANWEGRRIVNEHAQIEDAGLESGGISALRGEQGYDPITVGKDGEEGFRAARVVFGKPGLLPAPEK